jgi:Mg-chelatase subunit ChlD
MKKIAIAGACVFALTPACGDSSGTSNSASAGLGTITSASAGPTGSTGDDPTGSASQTDGSASHGSHSASGTTEGDPTGDPGTSSSGDASGSSTDVSSSTTTTTTGTTADETTGDGTTGAPVKMPCQVEETHVEPVPPSVLLILDKSGSMSMESWDHDNNAQTATVTRWYSLYKVVESVVNKFDSVVHFGVKLYPKLGAGSYVDQGACIVTPGVEVPIAPMNKDQVLSVVPAANFMVLGGTPMETGLKEGFTYLNTLDPGLQRFAILVADGEISDTCQGENILQAVAAVEDAYNLYGIPTYVVGIDVDPSTSEQLTTLADAGGKPKPGPEPFYQTTNQIELEAAIQGIIDDTLSCVIAVDPAPDQPDLFEVWIGNTQIDKAGSCADNGWVWTKDDFTEIELCGDSCKLLKKTGEVEARYFCVAG